MDHIDESVRQPARPPQPGSAELTHSGLDKSSSVYTAVSSYRASFRAQQIPASYRAWKHFGLINVCGIAAALWTGWMAGGPVAMLHSPRSLTMMLLAFALANGFEYYAHRFKLHNPLVHTRHSHTHHRFFTDKVMEYDSFADAHAILFPERAPLFLIGIVLPVLSLLPTLILGRQAGAAFACMLACYYLSYEWLHLAYHAPPHSWLGSLPGVAVLRRHHQVHHSQTLMGKWNFNITWPIADFLYGTTYRPAPPQQVHAQ